MPLPLVTPPTLAESPPNRAVAHLTVARPNSSNAVRPQPVRKHEDMGKPRADNPPAHARLGVNQPQGMLPLVTTDPRHGFCLVAGVPKSQRSWRHTAPKTVTPARAARRAAATTGLNPAPAPAPTNAHAWNRLRGHGHA